MANILDRYPNVLDRIQFLLNDEAELKPIPRGPITGLISEGYENLADALSEIPSPSSMLDRFTNSGIDVGAAAVGATPSYIEPDNSTIDLGSGYRNAAAGFENLSYGMRPTEKQIDDMLLSTADVLGVGSLGVGPLRRFAGAALPKAAEMFEDASRNVGLLLDVAPKGPRKAVGNIFDEVDEYDVAKKIAERGGHLKRDASGQYVGAPRDVDSPQSLGRMRANVDRKVEEGSYNADWYDRARDAYKDVTGYDPATQGYGLASDEARQASLFSRGGAAYSPQASPAAETNAFLKQYNNKVLLGEDVAPRTGAQAKNVDEAFKFNAETGRYEFDPMKVTLGKKTGPYSDAKDPTIADEDLYKTANDIWHGRVFGYKDPDGSAFSRGFTPQEHGFLTGENVLASERATSKGVPVGQYGDSLEWTPRRAQAATWGAERFAQARADNLAAIKKAEKDFAKWQKADKKTRGPKPKIPAYISDDELRAYASGGIDDVMPRHSANETYEYVTGQNVGHLSGLNAADDATRANYSTSMSNIYGNRDPYYSSLQMYQKPQLDTVGEYMNSAGVVEVNPGRTARPLVELDNAPTGGPQLGAASREALDDVAFTRSVVNAQEAGAWNKFTPANKSAKTSEKTGSRITGDADELSSIKSVLEENGLDVINVGDALHVGNFAGDLDGKTIQKLVTESVSKSGAKVRAQPGRFESGYQEVPWGAEGSGQVTEELAKRIDQSEVQNFGQRLDTGDLPNILSEQNKIDQAFSEANNMPLRQDLLKLRGLLADPNVGFRGISDYIKKYGSRGLPAFVTVPQLDGLLEPSSRRER